MTPPITQCCCTYGAAVAGEFPEFECHLCPVHGPGFSEGHELCKRHRREVQCTEHPKAPMLVRRCEAWTAHGPHVYEHENKTYGHRCWWCPGRTARDVQE